MNFDVFGGFEITKDHHNRGVYGRSFWDAVEERREGLSRACGCYVFALRYGDHTTPIYVGKAERLVFRHECFSPAKKLLVDRQLDDAPNKRPILYLLPKVTNSGKLCKPTRREYPAIRFLENLLIGIAIERNPKLANIKQTKLLREMHVPGIINSGPGQQTHSVRELQGAFGLP